MYKLLPEEARDKVKKEYSLRRTAIIFAAVVVVGVAGLASALPSVLLSQVKYDELVDTVEAIKSAPSAKDGADSATWVKNLNTKLDALSPAQDNVRPTQFIVKVLKNKSSNISITSLIWARDAKGSESLTVMGIASDRKSLLNFENSLNDSGNFSTITFPVSSLAQDLNISFQIKLTLNKPK